MTEGIKNINFSDWQKLDLRVAQIKNVEDIVDADKLYKLNLDVGVLGKKTIVAGIKPYYNKVDLLNKKIIYLTNLEPKNLKGVESQGMLLAAGSPQENLCVLLTIDRNIKNGTKIS